MQVMRRSQWSGKATEAQCAITAPQLRTYSGIIDTGKKSKEDCISAVMIASPCTNICEIDVDSGFCIGCARTLDEIMQWRAVTDQQRQEIIDQLPHRKPLVKPPFAC